METKVNKIQDINYIMNEDNHLKTVILRLLEDMSIYHQKFSSAFEFLCLLKQHIASNNDNEYLEKSKTELYMLSLEKPGLGKNEYTILLLNEIK